MTARFIIPGRPQGKERPRISKSGGVYTPARTKAYENLIKGCYTEQCSGISFGSKSIRMSVKAYVPPLSRFRKAEKLAALSGEIKPTAKPDADNILKAVLDALNGLAYDDDRYIYKLEIEREYSENPRLEIDINDD
jgi:Holliday junction resolvase RusA-like endonuclease